MNPIPYLELKRKIAHVLFGISGILLLVNNLITPLQIFLILIVGLFISFLSLNFKIPVFHYFLEAFDRESDKRRLPGRGIIFAVAGSLLVLELFPKEIALASIAILAFADPISYLIGKVFGKTKSPLNPKKNIEGNIAGALISSLFALFFVQFYLAFSAALIAMIFELLVIKIKDTQLDDNLIIPLVAGTTMFLILRFLI
jgi:dolichol kinase